MTVTAATAPTAAYPKAPAKPARSFRIVSIKSFTPTMYSGFVSITANGKTAEYAFCVSEVSGASFSECGSRGVYAVSSVGGKAKCNCLGFGYAGRCKHEGVTGPLFEACRERVMG